MRTELEINEEMDKVLKALVAAIKKEERCEKRLMELSEELKAVRK